MKKVAIVSAALLALAACANTNETAAPGTDRTVVIQMRDNHFEPDRVDVVRGETISFRFTNVGRARHDAFIGDADAQMEHEEEARMADDEEGHGGGHEPAENAITVEPGKTGRLTYTFDVRGETLIGCHEPGHYDSGMVVKVTVE